MYIRTYGLYICRIDIKCLSNCKYIYIHIYNAKIYNYTYMNSLKIIYVCHVDRGYSQSCIYGVSQNYRYSIQDIALTESIFAAQVLM